MLALTLLLVAANGFFVAAEFALIRVRQTRIAELVEEGNVPARAVQTLMGLARYLLVGNAAWRHTGVAGPRRGR